MGETVARIKVTGLISNGSAEFDAVVDTGATHTTLPKRDLAQLGITPESEVAIELADGRSATRQLSNVLVELEGRRRANPILLGEDGDAAVIGVVTLESCGFAVDPMSRKLVPVLKIHHY
ncbi:MAG: aspartyl protease family protein [Elusimicrobia bacterium]|nr:aspartyl protease family protein [Elusimicrobiota bacterium]